MYFKSVKYYFLLCIFIVSCDLFTTRSPELPDDSNQIYVPPTSPEIVVDNFKRAIINKNVENYINCFISSESDKKFFFRPSSEVLASYPSSFDLWDQTFERRYFNSLISFVQSESKPILSFEKQNFEISSSDSVKFFANYSLLIQNVSLNYNTTYQGNLQFTIIPTGSGLWAIQSWYDNSIKNDSNYKTWSFLKAEFTN